MEAFECVRSLRAVRHFNSQPVERATIERILQGGRWSGSAKNTQHWQFVVVRERDTLAALSRCGDYASHLAGAPCGIVLVGEPGVWAFDLGRCAQNMMLTAWNEGVGSCIATLNHGEQARAALGGVPPNHDVSTAISLGYPAPADDLIEGQPRRAVLPTLGRRSLAEIVHWDRWEKKA
ncbi:MAG: nitroreductase family protein [Chloroflexota bacterium]